MTPPGELALDSRVSTGPDRYRFETADGVRSKESFRDAELGLLESLWEADLGQLLVPEANYGVVGTVLAERARAVHMTESSARAAGLCERNAERNRVDAAVSVVQWCTALDESFDAVAYAPKPYDPIVVGEQRIANALSALQPGGKLYLAASKRTGLARYEDCLRSLADDVTRRGTHGDQRILEATRPPTVDSPSYVSPRTIRATVDGIALSLVTVPGLFSHAELDAGTRLLLEAASVDDGERVLDLCCGYGPVGTYADLTADCEVVCSDDDAVATACAERSLRVSGADGRVVTGDCVEAVADRRFDRVLCNPPTHAGDGVLSALFDGVHDVLAPGGRLTLVHHRHLDLRRHLSAFDAVERRETGSEHVVLAVTR